MINNFTKIKKLLKWGEKGDFYFIQIIKRRKDNPSLPRDMKRVAEYYIYSMKYLEEHENLIIQEATLNNARVYIHLHKRNSKKTALTTVKIILDYLDMGDTDAAKTAYTSACGKQHSDKDKKWIIDVDDKNILQSVVDYVNNMTPAGEKVIDIIPTKNGYHVVTKPFRKDKFNKHFPNTSIHNNSPTLLYMP